MTLYDRMMFLADIYSARPSAELLQELLEARREYNASRLVAS